MSHSAIDITSDEYSIKMGNYFSSQQILEEKLCKSCHMSYQLSRWSKDGGGRWWHGPESIPYVAQNGHPECLAALIKTGAVMDKHKRKSVYQDALQMAATWGKVACVQILVEVVADVNKSGYR